jgi:CspA family cold shock protein
MAAKEPLGLEAYTQHNEETTPEVFQASGTVKWFDPSKGYGFIVADDNLPDILLHVTCLRHSGLQTIREGARMVCEVMKSPRGLQAVQISRVTGKEWW